MASVNTVGLPDPSGWRHATVATPSSLTPTPTPEQLTLSLFEPAVMRAGADHVRPSSVDVAITASFLPSVRERPSSHTAYTAPLFGCAAEAGSPPDARCAVMRAERFWLIWMGGAKASGAGYGVEPATGARSMTWLLSPLGSGSSWPVGAPIVVVSMTIPSAPLLSTIG